MAQALPVVLQLIYRVALQLIYRVLVSWAGAQQFEIETPGCNAAKSFHCNFLPLYSVIQLIYANVRLITCVFVWRVWFERSGR